MALANADGGEFIVGIDDRKAGSDNISRWQGFEDMEDGNFIQQSLVDDVQPPSRIRSSGSP